MRSLKTNRVVAGVVFTVLTVIAVAVVMVLTSGNSALAQQARQATTPAQPAAAIPGSPGSPARPPARRCSTPTTRSSSCSTTRPACSRPSRTSRSRNCAPTPWCSPRSPSWPRCPIITRRRSPTVPTVRSWRSSRQAAPSAKYVARKGEISAWDNADFVKAVEATGRKTLVMAGVWTSVCVAFPALQAKADGLQGVRGDGRLGRHEPDGVRGHARPDDAGRSHPRDHQRRAVRVPADLESSRRRAVGRALRRARAATTAPWPRATRRPRTPRRSPRSNVSRA